jgi:hypothetical protein
MRRREGAGEATTRVSAAFLDETIRPVILRVALHQYSDPCGARFPDLVAKG